MDLHQWPIEHFIASGQQVLEAGYLQTHSGFEDSWTRPITSEERNATFCHRWFP